MRRTLARSALVGGLLGGTLLACQLLAGIEEVPKVEPTAPPPPPTPSAIPDPCGRQDVPPRTGLDDSDASLPTIDLALRTLEFVVDRDDQSPVGFDLDRVCTCETRPSTRWDGGASCVGVEPACDFDGGVDNQVRSVFKQVEQALLGRGFRNVDELLNINDQVATGRQTVLFSLSGYNGMPNDREVSVGMFLSNGIVDPKGCPTSEPSNEVLAKSVPDDVGKSWTWRPQWCGSDIWTFDPTSTTGGGPFPRANLGGYVTNGKLVVASSSNVTIGFGGSTLQLSSPRIVANVVRNDAGGFVVADGIFGGRVSVDAFLESVGRVYSKTDGSVQALCDPSNGVWYVAFRQVRGLVCNGRDVLSDEALDGKGLGCDAISLAFRFRAEPVGVGAPLAIARPSLDELGCTPAVQAGELSCPPVTPPGP